MVVTTGGSSTAQKSVVAKLSAVAEKAAGLDSFTGPVVVTVQPLMLRWKWSAVAR